MADNSSLVRKVAFPADHPARRQRSLSQFTQFVLMYVVIVPIGRGARARAVAGAAGARAARCCCSWPSRWALALLTSTAYVYFRDTRHLVEVALQIWFWLTPVVYAVALVPEALAAPASG